MDVAAALWAAVVVLQVKVEGAAALGATHAVAEQLDGLAADHAVHGSSIVVPAMPRFDEEPHRRFHALLALRARLSAASDEDRPALVQEYAEADSELRELLTPEPRKPNRFVARTERLIERVLEKIPGYQKL